jgi:zeaxanthin glucosyltransferase
MASCPREFVRILLASTKERGHLNPMIPVAQALRRRGHHVGWLCLPTAPANPPPIDIDWVTAKLPTGPEMATDGEELAALVRQPRLLADWIRTLLLDAVPMQLNPLQQAIEAFRPDVIGTDPMLYGVVLGCHRLKLPWVGISSSLNPVTPPMKSALQNTLMELAPQRQQLFEQYGCEAKFAVADCLSPWATTVFTTEEYVGKPGNPTIHLVGPSIPSGQRGDEPDVALPSSYVLASFGSQISHQPEAFERIVAAVAGPLVLSVGALASTTWARSLPSRVTAVQYIPQHMALTRATAFVTHGGANSVMEAIFHGVPMLISPVCNDQPHQAYFASKRGVARVYDVGSGTTAGLRDSLRGLETDGELRRALDQVRASYRDASGADAVATLLEQSR